MPLNSWVWYQHAAHHRIHITLVSARPIGFRILLLVFLQPVRLHQSWVVGDNVSSRSTCAISQTSKTATWPPKQPRFVERSINPCCSNQRKREIKFYPFNKIFRILLHNLKICCWQWLASVAYVNWCMTVTSNIRVIILAHPPTYNDLSKSNHAHIMLFGKVCTLRIALWQFFPNEWGFRCNKIHW